MRRKRRAGSLVKSHKDKYTRIENNKSKCKNVDKKLLNRVKIYDIENPIEDAIKYYNNKDNDNQISVNTNIETLLRVTLNYVRHERTNYDDIVRNLGLSGNFDSRKFKRKVNKKILLKYSFELKILFYEG